MSKAKPDAVTRTSAISATWPTYRLFGLTLASEFPFASQLEPGDRTPDVAFTVVPTPPLSVEWDTVDPVYTSPYKNEDEDSILSIYRLDNCDVLRFAQVADFYLWPDRIICHCQEPAYDYLVELRLLGPVLAYWLEQHGIATLHASAVAANGFGIGFLSGNKGGKSALAATFMQAGHPLLTDDVLPIENHKDRLLGQPGYPQMRLWADEAEHFLGHNHSLKELHPELSKYRLPIGTDHFGTFCRAAQPLTCLYVPERHDPTEMGEKIIIIPISPRERVVELVRHSFIARIVEAMGLQPHRLGLLAQLAQRVPMRRIVYPVGFQHLARVRDTILASLAGIETSIG
jgi:hypothetical protein